jgi:KaiC/GvpD/RAD55 family RecA-like ATPase
MSTGVERLDQLLGGGLARQSIVVIGGLPGSGKSTLAFHMMAEAVRRGAGAMLVTTTHQPPAKLRAQYSRLNFLGPTGVFDHFDFLELDDNIMKRDASAQNETLVRLLNAVVGRVQEKAVGIVAIDSLRAITEVAESKGQVWRFLGTLSAYLIAHDCIGVLLGEYLLPRDLDLPELAMADAVIYLEVDRLVSADVRTLRVYKVRGGSYTEGRQAFNITDNGISFLGG